VPLTTTEPIPGALDPFVLLASHNFNNISVKINNKSAEKILGFELFVRMFVRAATPVATRIDIPRAIWYRRVDVRDTLGLLVDDHVRTGCKYYTGSLDA
jgi:hypothetical protein